MLQGMLVRAVARIVDVGGHTFVAGLDCDDGMHIDFPPRGTGAECLRQIQFAADRLGLKVDFIEEADKLPSGRIGRRDAFAGGPHAAPDPATVARAEHEAERERVRAYNALARERNAAAFDRTVVWGRS